MTDPFNLNPEADGQKLLAQVVDYYHRTLKESTVALDYLRGRGITNGEAIEHFRIGYADRTLGLKLPAKQLKPGKLIRGRLQEIGVIRASGHEHLNGCVVFPVTAADGSRRIADIYGRKVQEYRLRKGTPLDMHLDKENCGGVWNVEAFSATDEVILCSSLFDALTFWNFGYRNVSCTFGPDALTDDHFRAFDEFKIRRVLTTVEQHSEKLIEAGIECYFLRFPSALGANKYALQVDDPSHNLGQIIRKAEWLGKGRGPVRPDSDVVIVPEPLHDLSAVSEEQEATDDENIDDWLDEEETEHAMSEDVSDTESSVIDMTADQDVDDEAAPIQQVSPLPPPPPADTETAISRDEVVMEIGNRRYRVRGLGKNLSYHQLKINLLASTDRGLFVDTFDLYSAKHRRGFTIQAAIEIGVEESTIKKDLGRVLLKLEELQDQQIREILEPKETGYAMDDDEREEALQFLRDPKLLSRIVNDFNVVGEHTNKLIGYLAAVSRKLDEPLAVVVQSSSAAGKTSLMDAILSFVPEEDQVKYSAMTGQSLYYMGEGDLQHKILAVAEDEGAQRASYALKLLQSEGELVIASTGKDATSGRLVTQEYRVAGPVMIFLTTTSIKIDEELLNRCLVLTVDEDRQQTRAIHQAQRRRQTLDGLLARQDRKRVVNLHRNAQRLLRPLLVANPYAEDLTFTDDKTRSRRDHLKYLTLIRTIALLHQFQRPIKTVAHEERSLEYIEVTFEDIDIANQLATEVLGRSADDLPPQTRRLLDQIDAMVTSSCSKQGIDRTDLRFSRRDVREYTAWGNTQLKVHLKRLEEMEYLLVHRGGRGQSFVYELLYEPPPENGSKFLANLIDGKKLRRKWSEQNGQKSACGREQAGAKSGPGRPPKSAASPGRTKAK